MLRNFCSTITTWTLAYLFFTTLTFSVEINENKKKVISDEISDVLSQLETILVKKVSSKVYCKILIFSGERKPLGKEFIIYQKNGNILMIANKPESDKGKKILMVKDGLWQYFPKAKKTIVINSAMLIGGNASFTDVISSTLYTFYNYDNYEFDKISKTHIITFKAKNRKSAYGKVRYFLKNNLIIFFEAYARSGILLKKIDFIKYETTESNQFYPVYMKITNALQNNDYTLIQMESFSEIEIPDYYFSSSSLENQQRYE